MNTQNNQHKQTIPFPDEIIHLETINKKLDLSIAETNSRVERVNYEYINSKKYMTDYRGELDPHEMFQNELALKQIDRTGAFAVEVWDKLMKIKESPYFARIDFQEKDEQLIEKIYIGRFSFLHENELLIYDWRSPIASMFYDYETGPAKYDAPIGQIEGALTLKRQFKIKNGILEYALESSINIQDDVLQRVLSDTSSEKMKSIISTIQKKQNQIIRNEKNNTIIIQGVAGSGKTSIALHRIAFLLYRFKNKLSARNITIISPNKVFGDYISTVLPELGEEPIYELSFENIAQIQLEDIIQFESDKDPLETKDIHWAKRTRFKSTLYFVKQMNVYLSEISKTLFVPKDYIYDELIAPADFIKERFFAYQSYPIKKRLQLIADDIYHRFTSRNTMGYKVPRPRTILSGLNKMLKMKSTIALYKEFYKWLDLSEMFVLPAKKTLEWSDVYPFLYLHAAFEGLQESQLIKHLVIDEMQDYTPIQFAVINQLFPCQKTILGDFKQLINPNHLNTIEDIQTLYNDAIYVELTKSYRSTYEIITFANKIQNIDQLEPVERHGETPQLIFCKNKQDEMLKLKKKLKLFQASYRASLGIIVRTNSEAKSLYSQLLPDYNINLISPESTRFEIGISITSIQMSKGLEFDEVIILNVNHDNYKTDYDRSLLYIAVTRCMHQLT
ncbi:MAG: HelD family protein, partial [Coprobacillus cateniformis]|uniref:HelD family protein n=1 Tax=Coprobacillus cateniformis TaxID=100884 RepID=UPI003990B08D